MLSVPLSSHPLPDFNRLNCSFHSAFWMGRDNASSMNFGLAQGYRRGVFGFWFDHYGLDCGLMRRFGRLSSIETLVYLLQATVPQAKSALFSFHQNLLSSLSCSFQDC